MKPNERRRTMKQVLMSIKPKYVEKMKHGEKQFEFRRSIFKDYRDVAAIYIYSTAPVKRIVASFMIDDVIEDAPSKLWEKCKDFSGIEEEPFFDYFKDKETGFAIKIKELRFFKEPIDPKQRDAGFVPPQSYRYIAPGENIIAR